MEFRDLKKQYSVLKNEINNAILEVINDTNFISGAQVQELEKTLSSYVGVKHCISCANGTDALSLVLKAWNIGPGDFVFVPAFTFFASAEVVATNGATPIFVDVREDTFNIDTVDLVSKIEDAIYKNLNIKCIISVDLFGQPADYVELEVIANKYKLLLLEDGAQGFGGAIGERKCCSFGDAAITSFFPAKPLGCYGDGGAIFTNDDNLAKLLRSLIVHGKGADKYDNVLLGTNSRLDTIQAAILNVKFNAFVDYELRRVNEVYEKYNNHLVNIVKVPIILEGFYSSFAQYTILLPSRQTRDFLKSELEKKGIPTNIYYPKPLHLQGAFSYLNYKKNDFPISEMLTECILSLPMHPYLLDEEIIYISQSIISILGN